MKPTDERTDETEHIAAALESIQIARATLYSLERFYSHLPLQKPVYAKVHSWGKDLADIRERLDELLFASAKRS